VFDHWIAVEDVTTGYTVTLIADMPGDGLSVEAVPLDLNQR
jgi:hypothetical protein